MVGLLVAVVPAGAGIVELGANLTGGQEVPAVVTDALAQAALSYNPATDMFESISVTVSGIALTDLRPNPGRFHIHAAPAGVGGGVILDLGSLSPFVEDGGNLTYSINDVALPNAAANETLLLNDGTYLNIHTNANTGGEIRGQIFVIPEPATVLFLSPAAAILFRRRFDRSL